MGFNCAPFVALFRLCYERDFILSISDKNVVDAFNSTSRYPENLPNIDNHFL